MDFPAWTKPRAGQTAPPANGREYREGELVLARGGYQPLLCQVIRVEAEGRLRVRGLDWAPGYSALVDAEQVRPAG